jgi:hypothetical protein
MDTNLSVDASCLCDRALVTAAVLKNTNKLMINLRYTHCITTDFMICNPTGHSACQDSKI